MNKCLAFLALLQGAATLHGKAKDARVEMLTLVIQVETATLLKTPAAKHSNFLFLRLYFYSRHRAVIDYTTPHSLACATLIPKHHPEPLTASRNEIWDPFPFALMEISISRIKRSILLKSCGILQRQRI